MNPVIQTVNLIVGYKTTAVVSDINILGGKGELICLLGPNGSGKSTVLKTLTGLIPALGGSVLMGGVDLRGMKKSLLAKKMAIVLTEQTSINFMTVYEIVSMGRYPYTNFLGHLSVRDKQLTSNALELVNAEHLSGRYYSSLSDGEKQKIMIARAIVQEPEVIVLDEPTSHLDLKHKIEVINILKDLCCSKRVTVIMSLHDVDLAVKGCDKLFLIKNGKIISGGAPEEIFTKGSIQELYNITGARYNELFGSFEFLCPHMPRFFVTGGAGTGTGVYRALARSGYGLCCGILHQNDADAYVAETLGCDTVVERAFTDISDESFNRALNLMRGLDFVIDTGFPAGGINRRNEELIDRALKEGKTVITFDNNRAIYRNSGFGYVYLKDVRGLLDYLKNISW